MAIAQTLQVAEATRLESLWRGDFGDDYVNRNRNVGDVRAQFWQDILTTCDVHRVLEVGCNLGANLLWFVDRIPEHNLFGIDVNSSALDTLRESYPRIQTLNATARELPFRDGWFDLVFTQGVLIHQPESTLHDVMSEIVRCSNKYVLCGEYFSEDTVEVPYRGQAGALFKRDYGEIYEQMFPNLILRKRGFLGRDQGWDDVTFWLFEKE